MKSFEAQLLKADGPFYEGPLEMLIIPATDGLLGIQAGHSDLVAALKPGVMKYRLPGEADKEAAISEGMVKVEKGRVLVLAQSIERPEEIDINRARRKEAAAKEAMLQKMSIREYQLAEMRLQRTINQLKVKRKELGRM